MPFEILILIITLSSTIGNVIVPSEYTEPCVKYHPIDTQFYIIPNQYRTSEFYYQQPNFYPIYLNDHQINNPQSSNQEDSDPLLGSPQDSEIPSQVGYPRHFHALKIGGHKIVKPSYIFNKVGAIPSSTIHRRFKKSIEGQSDSGKSGESNTFQSNPSISDRSTWNNKKTKNSDNSINEDKETQAKNINNDSSTPKTLFNLNPQNVNPTIIRLDTLYGQDNYNPTNKKDSKTEPSSSNSLNMPNESSKPIELNIQTEKGSKYDEAGDPFIGSIKTEGFNPLINPAVQQIYPTWLSVYNYNQNPLRNNLVYHARKYQPSVNTIMYYSSDGFKKVLIPKMDTNQQWLQQQQCENGMNQVTDLIPSSGYTYWPTYSPNHILQYPKLSYYNPLSVYPNNYAPYVQNTQL
ncbi:hypothetical protein M0802_009471 [Mischocyttarus mexicanus]|nr:hypothetical protein M0802_009471 [Mischocyttarus mexicanus]